MSSSRAHLTSGQITTAVIAGVVVVIVIAATVVLPAWH